MAKKHFGKLLTLAAIVGAAAAGVSYVLQYKSFHKELDEDFHDFEDDFDDFDDAGDKEASKASDTAASEYFMFIYFFCPTACPPHGEAERRPASEQSCRQGMFPPRGFCGGFHNSAA